MPLKGETVGELCDHRGTFHVEWEIPDYFLKPHKTDTYMESPTFLFSNSTWVLRIYPNGKRADNTVEWIQAHLHLENPKGSYTLTFYLGIKHLEDIIYVKPITRVFNAWNPSYGWKLLKRGELQKLKHKYAPLGVLTLHCIGKLSSVSNASSQTTLLDSTNILSGDFKELFLSGQYSDVILEVDGSKFRCHKLILGTRSPVFKAMFQHDMKENNVIVKISDCVSHTFNVFLQFVYTGQLDMLTSENMVGLYTTADKYDLKDLKEQCVEFMEDNLSVDTVCDIFSVAEKHDEAELRDSAKDLLIRNIKTILPTENWKTFYRENALLAVEILMTVVPGASYEE